MFKEPTILKGYLGQVTLINYQKLFTVCITSIWQKVGFRT